MSPTPIVKGDIALEVYKEANQERSEASQRGAQKLAAKFSTGVTDYTVERLSEKNIHLINDFSCVGNDEKIDGYTLAMSRRIRRCLAHADDYFRKEAFYEQKNGLNTIYLFINNSKILAYMSLCNDAIRMDFDKDSGMGLALHQAEPAIRITSLAVSNSIQGQGFEKELIDYAVTISQKIREYSGVLFLTMHCYNYLLPYYSRLGFKKNVIEHSELPFSAISMRLVIDEYLANIDAEE